MNGFALTTKPTSSKRKLVPPKTPADVIGYYFSASCKGSERRTAFFNTTDGRLVRTIEQDFRLHCEDDLDAAWDWLLNGEYAGVVSKSL